MALPFDGVVSADSSAVDRLRRAASASSGARRSGGQFGDLGPVVQAGLQDAAHDRDVEFAGAQQQPGEQVQSGVAAEVAHRGGVALAHLDQARGGDPLERLAHGRPRHPEHLGEATLAGQRLTGLHLAAEDVGDDLLEDVLGDRASADRLQCHAPSLTSHR